MVTFSLPSIFRRRLQKINGGPSVSLKKRVIVIFAALICFIAAGTTYLVIKQGQASARNAQVADASRRQMLLGSEILDALSEIDQRARLGEATTWEVRRFRELMQNYAGEFKDSKDAQDLLSRLDIRFQTYVHALSGADPLHGNDQSRSLLRTYYQDVANTVNGLIELNANSTFKTLHEINLLQEKTSATALYFLAGFILLCVFAGYIVIAVVTRPLTSLVNFLDRVNVEDDLPGEVPELQSQALKRLWWPRALSSFFKDFAGIGRSMFVAF